uniref:non-specific serine/threonine protein kinase n=1 Tax=Tanacetum cinerariifolium TaxID=118510 RepID=A0A699HVQ4_TANCI|nr:leucine-rich repeat protein [Tanacetum cinerariifolium]
MKSRQPIICLSFSSRFSSFLFSSLFIFLATTITSLSYSGNETDHHALLKFKSVITNDPYGALTSWSDSSHFRTWYGVSCGKRHRRVTALVLESQGLIGFLSPHVGNLSFLRVLSLSNNSIQGAIPHELGRLSRLQRLVLELNHFEGTIPTNLSGCSNLEELYLENNKLVGSIPKEISCFLPKLTVLVIGDNTLTGGIRPFLGNLTSLEVFGAPDNPFNGIIPDTFGRLKSLTEFDCGTCVVLPNIMSLQLYNNKLSGILPPSLSNSSKLQQLEVSENNFSGKLTIDFAKLTDIREIFLRNNNLHGDGEADDMKFIDTLKNCSRLFTLNLVNCSLYGELPRSIDNLSDQLDSLYLEGNHLHGIVPSSGNLVGLTRVYLDSNQFKGRIPGIGMLGNLGYVDLYGNKFSGPIPDAIGNLSLLVIADLSSNRLNGHIPSSLGNFRNLIVLDLDDNELSGNIPKQLLQLPYLTILLNLSQNQLSGPLPTEVGDLQMLSQLDLSYNNLSGNIPSSVGGCASLTFLSIRANSGFSFDFMNLSFNDFDGEVPVLGVFANSSAFSILGNNRLCGGLVELGLLIDVATALDYLHNQCVATIVHGDLKPSNILLDDDMLAHVGDFGLARFLGTELNQYTSTGIRGTIGYAPPEYGLGSAMTSSGDVYSFGILLLEVMTGKKPTDNAFNEGLSLHEFSFIALPGHVTDVIDSDAIFLTEANAQKMEECLASNLKIGVSCSVDSPPQRMNIENVVHQLRHILDVHQNIEVYEYVVVHSFRSSTKVALLKETPARSNAYYNERTIQSDES